MKIKSIKDQLTADEVRCLKVGDLVKLNWMIEPFPNGSKHQFIGVVAKVDYQNIFIDHTDYEGERTIALWFNRLQDNGIFQNHASEEDYYRWSISKWTNILNTSTPKNGITNQNGSAISCSGS